MNNGSWTSNQKNFLGANVSKLTLKEIAEHIGKTERAVKLYCHRNRIILSTKRNLIIQLLTAKLGNPEYFMPTKDFYKAVGISQRRWWDLYFGRQQVTPEEYLTICLHLKVTPQEALESRQLELFNSKNEK